MVSLWEIENLLFCALSSNDREAFWGLWLVLTLKKIIIMIKKNHFICRTAAETDLWVLIFNFVHDHLFFSKFIIIFFLLFRVRLG